MFRNHHHTFPVLGTLLILACLSQLDHASSNKLQSEKSVILSKKFHDTSTSQNARNTRNVRNIDPVYRTPCAFASPSIPPPPPISMPVWSLASPFLSKKVNESSRKESSSRIYTNTQTQTQTQTQTSMNIITFATPVSVAPPKLWMISLYNNTMTRDAFLSSNMGVLQLLSTDQGALIPLLGKRSGYEQHYSKPDECRAMHYDWVPYMSTNMGECNVIPRCACYIEIQLIQVIHAGDHDACLVEVIQTSKWDEHLGKIVACDSNEPPVPLDPSNALYTAQLRAEGII